MRHDVCASTIKETNTCLLSYRDGIERFCAGNTITYPNTFNKQRIKERNSGVQFHYFILLRIRTCSCKCFYFLNWKLIGFVAQTLVSYACLCTCVNPPPCITLSYSTCSIFRLIFEDLKKEIRLWSANQFNITFFIGEPFFVTQIFRIKKEQFFSFFYGDLRWKILTFNFHSEILGTPNAIVQHCHSRLFFRLQS